MKTNAAKLKDEIFSKVRKNGKFDKFITVRDDTSAVIKINNVPFLVTVQASDNSVAVILSASSKAGGKHLRNIAAPLSWLTRNSSGQYILSEADHGSKNFIVTTSERLVEIIELSNRFSVASPHGNLTDLLPMYWWDSRANFGDEVGPWVGTKITGQHAVNMRGTSTVVPTVMAVGSIFAQMEHSKTDVWGTGLISPLTDAQIEKLRQIGSPKIYAVRGKLSAREIRSSLGWEVPDVYGDPALLIPRYFSPKKINLKDKKIGFVPHYAHSELTFIPDESFESIDVSQDLESVAQKISQSKSIVSTSLHGIIVAQAYKVPWVWLRLKDAPLKGDDFKFNDFFSTLEEVDMPIHEASISDEIDVVAVANQAKLPQLAIDLDLLEASFPKSTKTRSSQQITPVNSGKNIKTRVVSFLKKGVLNRVDELIKLQKKQNQLQASEIKSLEVLIDITRKNNQRIAQLEALNSKILDDFKVLRSESTIVRASVEVSRRYIQSDTYREIREILGNGQRSLLDTLEVLATSEQSFARFGDGEFRLLGHPDEDISFQSNDSALRIDLQKVLNSSSNNLLVGFPQIYKDTNWSAIWAEIWPEVRGCIPSGREWGNAHVTRPLVFKKHRMDAVQAWRRIWENKSVCVITGKSSRFELIPELFDNVSASARIDSLERDAYSDIDRLVEAAKEDESDIFLIALGPAGTILAHKLAENGMRGLDIGHLSDSYLNVFKNAKRPEYKPVKK